MRKKTDKNIKFNVELPPFVKTILERLRQHNFMAYVVGGALRDVILGRGIIDWDISTNADTGEIKSVFSDTRHYSLKHETVTLVKPGNHFEITTMRGKGSPELNINTDLNHRDFTINAMAYDDINGIILDPHDGRIDIEKKIVRGVLDPEKRFLEDPLRMLRAVRIAAELGFKIENKTLNCISINSELLKSVSVERIRDEFLRILLAERPSRPLNILRKTGLLKEIIPELLEGYRKKQNKWHRYTIYRHVMEAIDHIPSTPVLRLAALLHDIAKPRVREKINGEFHFYNHEKASAGIAKEIMERLRFSNEEVRKVTSIVSLHMIDYNSSWSDGAVRRLMKRAGNDIDDLIRLRRADIQAHGIEHNEYVILDELEHRIKQVGGKKSALRISDLAVDGKKIMNILNLKQGPDVGNILNRLHEMVIDDPDFNTEERLIEFLLEAREENRIRSICK
ncbi:CCA tRNA nucleotidyltransferase [Thermodesulfobacteriota bacterium]